MGQARANARKLQKDLQQRVAMQSSGSAGQSVKFSLDPRVHHLRGLHDEFFVVAPSPTETIIGMDDLSEAMLRSAAALTAELGVSDTFIGDPSMRRSVQAIEGMVRLIGGAAAEIAVKSRTDDDGEPEYVVTVGWPSSDEGTVITWNSELLSRVARETPARDRAMMVIVPEIANAN